jgi:hypothetical protein
MIKTLRQFLGFTGYYRVPNYAQIVKPLNDLLQGHGLNKGYKKYKKNDKNPVSWVWVILNKLLLKQLKKLVSPPIFGCADYTLPFILHTDASSSGLGAVLLQNQDCVDRVIAYARCSLRHSEQNYPARKLEFIALKWSVTDKFRDYLYGNEFVVKTDSNPLTYVTTSAKLDATQHRWLAELSNYNTLLWNTAVSKSMQMQTGCPDATSFKVSSRQSTKQLCYLPQWSVVFQRMRLLMWPVRNCHFLRQWLG